MPVLDTQFPTLLDLANLTDPDGSIPQVVELLRQHNEMLIDMMWKEGNLLTGNMTTIRNGLPTVAFRKLYGGIQPSKSRTTKVTDATGMLEAMAEVDAALIDINDNAPAFRMTEESAFIQSMSNTMQDTVLFGNSGLTPEAFTGFAPRYSDLSAPNSRNIIDALGTGTDNRSIWLIGWGDQGCHGIVPKASVAGLQTTDYGKTVIEDIDGNGGRMVAYRTHYRWDGGLTVRDWQYAVRICNIPYSNLSTVFANGEFATGPHLPELMFQALDLLPSGNAANPVFYMSREMLTFVRQQTAAAVQGSTLTTENVGGVRTTMFQGMPIRKVDALASDEARIT